MQEDNNQNTNSLPSPGAVVAPIQQEGATLPSMPANPDTQAAPIQPPVVTMSQSVPPPNEEIDDNPQNETVSENTYDGGFSWTGPQFVQHEKSSNWLIIVMSAGLILGVIVSLLTRDILSSVSVAVALIVLGLYSLRKPQDITYLVTDTDISIGSQSYSYGEFRSFTANVEGNYLNVTFMPLKRFATTTGLYYQGPDEDRLIKFLSDRLPMEKHNPDLVEVFLQRIRF